jgi:hypothetical protein
MSRNRFLRPRSRPRKAGEIEDEGELRPNLGTFYAVIWPKTNGLTVHSAKHHGLIMKTPSPGSSADSLVQYLTLHTPILTEQGINVEAFINRLNACKQDAAVPNRPRSAAKPKDPKK